MRLIQLFETAKDSCNRLTDVNVNERLDKKKRMLSCIININPSEMKQEIYGFGGAITESSAYILSSLNETKKDEILTKYYKEMKYNLTRTHINSCDFSLSNWSISDKEGDFDTTRSDKYLLPILKAADRKAGGLKLMLTPWSPPAYMKTNGDMNHGGKLKKEYYKAWAEELNDENTVFVRYPLDAPQYPAWQQFQEQTMQALLMGNITVDEAIADWAEYWGY